MPRARTIGLVLLLPALALAQDAAAPDPTGTLLYDALPPGADQVLHAPSLPRLLASAVEAGIGTREAWGETFRAQLAHWGAASGQPDQLVRAGVDLLALADGEVVLASIELPRLGSPTAPRTRSAILAFRTRAKEPALRAHVDTIVAAGLSSRWPGPIRPDHAMGRAVTAMTGPFDGLWIRVEDHLVAAADHPLALGLFFRGLERVAREPRPKEDVANVPLRVRSGRDDAPLKWEGSTLLERESVAVALTKRVVGPASMHRPGAVMTWVVDQVADAPVFPVPLAPEVVSRAASLSARPLALRLGADGAWSVGGSGSPGEGERPVAGTASRLGWLRAIAGGTLPSPIPAVDPSLLGRVVAAAEAVAPKDAPEFVEWRAGEHAGDFRGPAWHGPVTFVALRALRDISLGVAPLVPQAPDTPVPPKSGPALPPPNLGPPSESGAPPKPVAPLPPPEGR